MFCTNSEHEIVFVLISRTVRTFAGLQLVQNALKSTKNRLSNFDLIGEIMDLFHILLALQDRLISIIKLATQKPFR